MSGPVHRAGRIFSEPGRRGNACPDGARGYHRAHGGGKRTGECRAQAPGGGVALLGGRRRDRPAVLRQGEQGRSYLLSQGAALEGTQPGRRLFQRAAPRTRVPGRGLPRGRQDAGPPHVPFPALAARRGVQPLRPPGRCLRAPDGPADRARGHRPASRGEAVGRDAARLRRVGLADRARRGRLHRGRRRAAVPRGRAAVGRPAGGDDRGRDAGDLRRRARPLQGNGQGGGRADRLAGRSGTHDRGDPRDQASNGSPCARRCSAAR